MVSPTPPYVGVPDHAPAKGKRPLQEGDDNATWWRQADFVYGRWEVELSDWRRHCIPNGWMVTCLSCVSIAQISVRVGADSFRSALVKQAAYNLTILAILALELVFVFQLIDNGNDGEHESYWTELGIIWGCVLFIVVLSTVWVKSLVKLRTRVRDRFQIPGSEADDKSAMLWCTTCAVAQMATQTKSYKPGNCDFNAPETLPAYIP